MPKMKWGKEDKKLVVLELLKGGKSVRFSEKDICEWLGKRYNKGRRRLKYTVPT